MAYQVYTTDAVVIGSEHRRSADKALALFTREAGLIHARAAGVRYERSKLRYGLQEFSRSRVSLVCGARGWRITGAECVENVYFASEDRAIRAALLRTVGLLRRLVRGEEAHPALYDLLADGLAALVHADEVRQERAERILALRLVAALGYVAADETLAPLIAAPTLSDFVWSAAGDIEMERIAIDAAVSNALAASHL